MEATGYRNSGELSDITIVIDGEEFHLHKFPLFLRSFYFKDLTLESSNTSRVELKNFPGGPKIFSIIADYCYNKQVQVNQENVIAVRCAAEYLKMNVSGSNCSGLALMAENILFDLTYSAKNKKDYKSILLLLKKAVEFAELSEKCLISRKLIDSFVENLSIYVKSENVYESIGLYEKSPSLYAPKKSLHNLSLNDDQINIINGLPLKWMNDFVRSAICFNLNPMLLSFLIQNYIDYNTNSNPNYNSQQNENNNQEQRSSRKSSVNSEEDEKHYSNLVVMANDIIKAEIRLNNLAEDSIEEETKNEIQKAKNELDIIPDETEKIEDDSAKNLINIANDILQAETKLEQLVDGENDSAKNLINIANDILHAETKLELLADETEEQIEVDSARNLINIANDILQAETKLEQLVDDDDNKSEKEDNNSPINLISIAGSILKGIEIAENNETHDNDTDTLNLIQMASDILEAESKIYDANESNLNLIHIADNIFSINKKNTKIELNNEEKLNLINNLTNTINEMRFDPKFPVSWLLVYLNVLNELNAESNLKSTFNRWTWNSINDLKSNSQELSSMPPQVMIKLAQDIAAYEGTTNSEYEKLTDLIDRYIIDCQNDKKLTPDVFIQLVSSIPKEKQNNYDNITLFVINLLEKEDIDPEMHSKLLGLIDFEKINEKTLKICQNSQSIPEKYICEAALSLCFKLREQLDEANIMLKSQEIKNNLHKNVDKYTSVYTPTKYSKLKIKII